MRWVITIAVRLDATNEGVRDYYLLPGLDMIWEFLCVAEENGIYLLLRHLLVRRFLAGRLAFNLRGRSIFGRCTFGWRCGRAEDLFIEPIKLDGSATRHFLPVERRFGPADRR